MQGDNFYDVISNSDAYSCLGMPEIASIYQTEEEREMNRPRRQAVPNPALEEDMVRYRQKIERRFEQSAMNQSFKMPKLPPGSKYNGR